MLIANPVPIFVVVDADEFVGIYGHRHAGFFQAYTVTGYLFRCGWLVEVDRTPFMTWIGVQGHRGLSGCFFRRTGFPTAGFCVGGSAIYI